MKPSICLAILAAPAVLIGATLGDAIGHTPQAIAMEPALSSQAIEDTRCVFTYSPDFSPVRSDGIASDADRTKTRIQHVYLSAAFWSQWACKEGFEAGSSMNWNDRMGTNQSVRLVENPQHWFKGAVLFSDGNPVVYTAAEVEANPEIKQSVIAAFEFNAALHQAGWLFEWAYPGYDLTH